MQVDTGSGLFLERLQRSGLMETEDVDQFVAQIEVTPRSDADLAEVLVDRNVLTRFQAHQLLHGRWRGLVLGNFRLMRVIARGGMGTVYQAQHLRIPRDVAIKTINVDVNTDLRDAVARRLASEARAIAALRHPNVIDVYDFDQFEGIPYIVMEYVDGTDLGRLVTQNGPLSWAQAADVVCQAAHGLEHIHAAGLIHRDISPANVMLDVNGQVRVIDLGLYSAGRRPATVASQDSRACHVGTLDYLSPEQASDGAAADVRSDIYSLGAVMYTIMAGRPPFLDDDRRRKRQRIAREEPVPIHRRVPGIPRQLASIVRKMIAKRPGDRFQTVAEVRSLLAPFAQRQTS